MEKSRNALQKIKKMNRVIYTKAAQNACSTKRVTRKISEFTVSKCAVTVKTERTVITYISNTLNN